MLCCIFIFFNRAMNYGAIGFLIAKDILHLILPDSKRSSHLSST